MKTALQELIDWMEEQYYPAMYEDAIEKATELLEKEMELEKHEIIMAFESGRSAAYNDNGNGSKSGEQYFNETFNRQ